MVGRSKKIGGGYGVIVVSKDREKKGVGRVAARHEDRSYDCGGKSYDYGSTNQREIDDGWAIKEDRRRLRRDRGQAAARHGDRSYDCDDTNRREIDDRGAINEDQRWLGVVTGATTVTTLIEERSTMAGRSMKIGGGYIVVKRRRLRVEKVSKDREKKGVGRVAARHDDRSYECGGRSYDYGSTNRREIDDGWAIKEDRRRLRRDRGQEAARHGDRSYDCDDTNRREIDDRRAINEDRRWLGMVTGATTVTTLIEERSTMVGRSMKIEVARLWSSGGGYAWKK
ncbi:hypothetical protein L1987_19846 [Smallanthus sonchifolius]|uniref:Uncharacterized protein n=1 Tax=Smallanthus sonchifolius TaxID=185202 RepID=A0ACB9IRW6_9ASTR|nr:hypothetical protein L1987_19846 [Smallanthus sonchifolius]